MPTTSCRSFILPVAGSSRLNDLPVDVVLDPSSSRTKEPLAESFDERYLRDTHGLPQPIPLNLLSLPDDLSSDRPNIGLLIDLAIWQSPHRRLLLSEIYDAIEERYPSWKEGKRSWRHSIRHKLSRMARYVKEARPAECPGRGSFWTLNTSKGNTAKIRRSKLGASQVTGSVTRRKDRAADSSRVRVVEEGSHLLPRVPQLYPRHPHYMAMGNVTQDDSYIGRCWPYPFYTMVPPSLGVDHALGSCQYSSMSPPTDMAGLRIPYDLQESMGHGSLGIDPSDISGPKKQRKRPR